MRCSGAYIKLMKDTHQFRHDLFTDQVCRDGDDEDDDSHGGGGGGTGGGAACVGAGAAACV